MRRFSTKGKTLMAEPFLGEIKLVPYNFAPRGWAFCNGQLLSIAQNTALLALLGTMYGGNGQTTFALPDLQGRSALGVGQGPGLSDYVQGEEAGTESVTLSASEMPVHGHSMSASSSASTTTVPTGAHPGVSTNSIGNAYGSAPNGTMPANAVSASGGGQPHQNRQPYLTLNYVIATEGIFPSRN
jgi:microcystin-dependent protein